MSHPRIPFGSVAPHEDASEIQVAIERVVKSGWYILGPEVAAFEAEFAAICGAAHAVGVGNGTDAIALVLRAIGVGPGDEVITTPLSAAYTALAIMMAGARPVFADIDPVRLCIAPEAVERAVTDRTRAIVPVHLYGQPADMRGSPWRPGTVWRSWKTPARPTWPPRAGNRSAPSASLAHSASTRPRISERSEMAARW
jgi:dTDP-4-amino-4,6-dideoxygalactose transaminase